jgi:hypothetical protein
MCQHAGYMVRSNDYAFAVAPGWRELVFVSLNESTSNLHAITGCENASGTIHQALSMWHCSSRIGATAAPSLTIAVDSGSFTIMLSL